MVHGTGSFGGGGGGGGGFSGGSGFSFTSTAVLSHHYSHSRHGRGEDCDFSWICVCCCCRGQSFQVRILTLWAWIVAIVLTTSLITVFHVNKTQKIEATITDMRKVPNSMSETFCDGASISSGSSQFTAWLFDGEPSVNTNDLQQVTFRKKTQIKYNKYEYWGFYLLSNSVIHISTCPDSSLEFLIIQGNKNFKEFQNGDCFYTCSVFSRSTSCNFNKPNMYHYKVLADEEYYLIFANRYLLPYPTDVAVNFTLEKRLYNLGNSVSECSNSLTSSSCTLHFPSLNLHPSIVLNVTSSSDMEGDAEIKVACISRKWVYVMVFFIVPLVLGALGTALIVKKYRKQSRQTPTSTQTSAPFSALPSVLEESESASSYAPGSGYGAVESPPKYEDATGSPPSYEEATK